MLLPTTIEDVQKYVCRNCRHKCELCGVAKSEGEFPKSMWINRFHKNQRTLCRDCSRPRCTSQHCKTCRTCRDPDCQKRKRCDSEIKALHWKLLPRTMEDVLTYLCQPCRSITCKCGNRMSQTMQRKRKAKPNSDEYVCVDCQNRALQASDKRYKTIKS